MSAPQPVRSDTWYLATFGAGDARYRAMARRLGRQARALTGFTPVVLTERNLFQVVGRERADAIAAQAVGSARGFGYMAWKSSIMRALLQRPCAGVVFVDAGCELQLTDAALRRLDEWRRESERVGYRLFEVEGPWTERMYTKHAVLERIPLSDDQLDARQAQSGVVFLAQHPEALALAERWDELAREDAGALLRDTDPDADGEDPQFVAHRHDQSLLSCLAKSAGWSIQPNETHPSAPAVVAAPDTYPILTLRNRRILSRNAPAPLRALETTAFRAANVAKKGLKRR